MNENGEIDQIQRRLEQLYRRWTGAGPACEDARTRDFCFHMTDWLRNLHALNQAFGDPRQATDEQFQHAVMGFLIHASGHILAATALAELEPVEFDIPPQEGPEGEKVGSRRGTPTDQG